MAKIFLAMRLAALLAASFIVVKQMSRTPNNSPANTTSVESREKVMKVRLAPPVRPSAATLTIQTPQTQTGQNGSSEGGIPAVGLNYDLPAASARESVDSTAQELNDASIFSCSGIVASQILQPNRSDISTLWKTLPQARKSSEESMGVTLLPSLLRGE